MSLPFDDLLVAISGAVVEAQHKIRQAHIGQVWSFFQDNAPMAVNLAIPRYEPGVPIEDGPQKVNISVPLLSLVNPKQLSIEQIQVTLQVDLNDVAASSGGRKAAIVKPRPESVYQWQPEGYKPVLEASTTTGKQPGQPGLAQITLTLAAEDIPEGLARLQDHLNKCL